MKTSRSNQATSNKLAKQLVICVLALFFISPAFSQEQAADYTYKYRVTAYKKGNAEVSSVSNIAEVVPALALYVPNSFTPNDDGLNDTFGAKGEGITEYKLMIYNVWGNLVFESKNTGDQWDGKHNGLLCAEGAYTYLIIAKGESSRVRKSGTVSLVM